MVAAAVERHFDRAAEAWQNNREHIEVPPRERPIETDGGEEPDQNSVIMEIISEIRKRPGLHLEAGGQLQQGAQEVIHLDEEEEEHEEQEKVQVDSGERGSSILEEPVAGTNPSEEPLSFSAALEELDSWMDLELPKLI